MSHYLEIQANVKKTMLQKQTNFKKKLQKIEEQIVTALKRLSDNQSEKFMRVQKQKNTMERLNQALRSVRNPFVTSEEVITQATSEFPNQKNSIVNLDAELQNNRKPLSCTISHLLEYLGTHKQEKEVGFQIPSDFPSSYHEDSPSKPSSVRPFPTN